MHRKNDDKNILNIVLIFAFVSDNWREVQQRVWSGNKPVACVHNGELRVAMW